MAHNKIEIFLNTPKTKAKRIISRIKEIKNYWEIGNEKKGSSFGMLVDETHTQNVTNLLLKKFNQKDVKRLISSHVYTVLPEIKDNEEKNEKKQNEKTYEGISQYELYENLSDQIVINKSFIILILISAIGGAMGLIQDNMAVFIGAMMLAPLLSPNVALALGNAIGDSKLSRNSLKTIFIGLGLSFSVSYFIGIYWDGPLNSAALLSTLELSLISIFLAILAGAAAVISLTQGLSKILVEIQIGAPAVAFGLMAGAKRLEDAISAALLLFINIICINLASRVVLYFKRVKPSTWQKKDDIKKAMISYISFWVVSLFILITLISFRNLWLSRYEF